MQSLGTKTNSDRCAPKTKASPQRRAQISYRVLSSEAPRADESPRTRSQCVRVSWQRAWCIGGGLQQRVSIQRIVHENPQIQFRPDQAQLEIEYTSRRIGDKPWIVADCSGVKLGEGSRIVAVDHLVDSRIPFDFVGDRPFVA